MKKTKSNYKRFTRSRAGNVLFVTILLAFGLFKLDYTKHPMSKRIVRKSIMDYNPAPPVTQSHNTEPVQEEPPKKKSSRKRNLYSTAQPPAGF